MFGRSSGLCLAICLALFSAISSRKAEKTWPQLLHDTLERVRSLSEAMFRFFSGFDDLAFIALFPVVVLGYSPASQERWQMRLRARDSMARMEAHNMLQKYKEIFYGGLFGFGAAVLDTFMDAWMEGLSFRDELAQHGSMLFYRTLFILFGLALGWLLWQKNKREREFRDLSETLRRFRQEYEAPALLMHTKLQTLLTASYGSSCRPLADVLTQSSDCAEREFQLECNGYPHWELNSAHASEASPSSQPLHSHGLGPQSSDSVSPSSALFSPSSRHSCFPTWSRAGTARRWTQGNA